MKQVHGTIKRMLFESAVTEASAAKLMTQIKQDLNLAWVKPGADFSNGHALLWSGEGATITVDGEKIEAFDSYGDEPAFIMGVAAELAKWSTAHGIYWEPHDAGTYLAYAI